MDDLDEHHDDLFWHALNYRTAASEHAAAMWLELEACANRLVEARLICLQNSQPKSHLPQIHSFSP